MTDYADLEKRLRDPDRANGKTPIGVYGQMIREGIEAAEALASLRRELEEAKALVAEANNSLYGSHGYFHSTNGGSFDKYHLSTAIEKLKDGARAWARVQSAAEHVTHYAYGRTPDEQVGQIAFQIIRERRAYAEQDLSRAVPSTETERSE